MSYFKRIQYYYYHIILHNYNYLSLKSLHSFQIDAVTSLLIRLTAALTGEESLFDYDYRLTPGSLFYRQRTPLDWDNLIEGPKILR